MRQLVRRSPVRSTGSELVLFHRHKIIAIEPLQLMPVLVSARETGCVGYELLVGLADTGSQAEHHRDTERVKLVLPVNHLATYIRFALRYLFLLALLTLLSSRLFRQMRLERSCKSSFLTPVRLGRFFTIWGRRMRRMRMPQSR